MLGRAAVALAVALALAALCTAAPQETYSTRYDNVNLQALLADPSQVEKFLKCFLQEGDGEPCSEMGRRVKAVLPEALPSDCKKCTGAQRVGLAKTVQFLNAKLPQQWKQLEKKFDPQGAYAKAHPELF
ncbi:hypothetical protein R5R35_005520 [Gryllus longicercus]|uniref:Chemosensory protein n=1 Tax=Gryllus longicercus TaxID=2509291 RepID=A0AAN9Z5V1_9ORTH